MTAVERRVSSELLSALGCSASVAPLLIERYAPISTAHRNRDVITAFWIGFNRHRQPDEWGAPEWRFFVEDALSHLREGGVLHLELNENPERYEFRRWYDQETLDLFLSVGTVYSRRQVRHGLSCGHVRRMSDLEERGFFQRNP